MPELAEVETIRRQIEERLPLPIIDIQFGPKIRDFIDPDLLRQSLIGRTLVRVHRHGKWLFFELNSGDFWSSHLGMSGRWLWDADPQLPHTHLLLKFHDQTLSYQDYRRFGKMSLIARKEVDAFLGLLPPDPLSPQFDLNYVTLCLWQNPRVPIKVLLLDQKLFPGIGNYLACEICAYAKVHPERPAGSLDDRETERIFEAIQRVIRTAVDFGGASFLGAYRDTRGDGGHGVENLFVFRKKWCRWCEQQGKRTEVFRMRLGGRITYYCPVCTSEHS